MIDRSEDIKQGWKSILGYLDRGFDGEVLGSQRCRVNDVEFLMDMRTDSLFVIYLTEGSRIRFVWDESQTAEQAARWCMHQSSLRPSFNRARKSMGNLADAVADNFDVPMSWGTSRESPHAWIEVNGVRFMTNPDEGS